MICKYCSISFTDPKHPNRTYCSRHCMGEDRKRLETRNCLLCGKQFQVRPASRNIHCSSECAYKNRPSTHANPDNKSTGECVVCGKSFTYWTYRKSTCCSRKCASTLSNGVPKPTKQRPDSYVTLSCQICGKPYTVHKIFTTKRNSRFCSKECQFVSMSVERRGAGNPQYIGGTQYPDRGASWSTQRKLALKRDGGKCRICGKKPKKGQKRVVDVHHIRPYREFNGDHVTANQLMNLITLCRQCHVDVEDHGAPCPMPLI